MDAHFEKERRTIMISGAGIAGLASALFIARAGYRVEVFEKAKKLDPVGSGLQLTPNAMQVLAELGLDKQIEATANAPVGIEIFNGRSGRKITDIRLGNEITQRYGQPYLVIHRADLQETLLNACLREPDILIRLGSELRDAVSHANGITAIADTNQKTDNYRGIALIGADGVDSITRRECLLGKYSVSTKTFALRALVESQEMPLVLRSNRIKMWLAPDAHAVVYPVRGGHYYSIVIILPDKFKLLLGFEYDIQDEFTGKNIAAGLGKWNTKFTQLLKLNTKWTFWPLKTLPQLKAWTEENIALVGDAAHAMTPHAAQGAAMGLEDAAVLGWAISTTKTLPEAFQLYQNRRIKRTSAISRLSETNRTIYQLPGALAFFRNLRMRIMGGDKILARQDWIYSWKLPKGKPE
ncbi:MAG: NAD(P)-binding protein [Hyphomicrobiales bacterium]|nr:NAD(P)-binding protein [Hyphomicrobiales bacterium]